MENSEFFQVRGLVLQMMPPPHCTSAVASPAGPSPLVQVVKYKKGQFYKMHHDQNSALYTPQGARMYTFFLYLKTPASGGATHFNDLDIHVEANRGNAILWPR